MRRILAMIIVSGFLTGLFLPTVSAQSLWQVVLLDVESSRVVYLAPEGITREVALPALGDFDVVNEARFSPDGQTLAFVGISFSLGESGIYLANLATGECCTKLPDPLPLGADFVSNGTFSPDGSQLAAVFSKVAVVDPAVDTLAGFLVIYDLATQTAAITVATSDLPGATADSLGAFIGTWTEAGLEVLPTCMGCDRPITGQFTLWNPNDGSIGATTPFENGGRKLPETSEMILIKRDDAYPMNPESILANVVTYYAAGAAAPITIYSNPDLLGIEDANWVINGLMVLVEHFPGGQSYLLGRDGQLIPVTLSETARFLAATPDGWLMHSDGRIIYFQMSAGTLTSSDLGALGGESLTLSRTAFTLTGLPFAPVE